MRNALIVGGVALGLYWLWQLAQPTNPINVNPPTSMTGAGQSVDGVRAWRRFGRKRPRRDVSRLRGREGGREGLRQQPVTSKLSLFRALTSISAKTPPAPAPIPSLSLVHGTTAVSQIT
jgi:hypothetical protein